MNVSISIEALVPKRESFGNIEGLADLVELSQCGMYMYNCHVCSPLQLYI